MQFRCTHLARLAGLLSTHASPAQLPLLLPADRPARPQEVETGAVDACQVAVARNGRLAGMATFGRTPGGAAATDTTLFSIFSCTKLTVAIAMWQLLEEGRVQLTDTVAQHVPGFGANGKDGVTILQLLTFTCGFPSPPTPDDAMATSAERRAAFAEWELDWAPGSQWAYQ